MVEQRPGLGRIRSQIFLQYLPVERESIAMNASCLLRDPVMMGRLRFPCRSGTAEAMLDEDGRWHCPEVPALVRVLDTLYSPRRDGATGDSEVARHHLDAAASWLRGTVE